MGSHPLNLALRFLLELAALASAGYWGWTERQGVWRVVWGIGLPLALAVLWGTFRVNGDPGDAPVPVPGAVRLLLELGVFATAVILLAAADQPRWAVILGVVVVAHYVASYDRIAWLLKQR